ncbi:hypothetical protein [Metallibacterium scheffleri]
MKRLFFTALACIFLAVPGIALAERFQKVDYIAGSIAENDGSFIRLLDGSSWVLSSPSLALVTDDVIIIFEPAKLHNGSVVNVAVAYLDGDDIIVKHVGGPVVTQTGYLTSVIDAQRNGAVLRLANGMLLSVPEYDQYDTSYWLPPYKVLLTGNEMYLYNLEKGKKIWVNVLR